MVGDIYHVLAVWKNSMYEPSERVPMMIAGPVNPLGFAVPELTCGVQGIKSGLTVTSLTSLLDVYPTLVELAGGTPPGIYLLMIDSMSTYCWRLLCRFFERRISGTIDNTGPNTRFGPI